MYRAARALRFMTGIMAAVGAIFFPVMGARVMHEVPCVGVLFLVWPVLSIAALWATIRTHLVISPDGIEFHQLGSVTHAGWSDIERINKDVFGLPQLELRKFTVRANRLADWLLRLTGRDCIIPLFYRSGSMWEEGVMADILHYAPHRKV